jgi:hypothetical protein
VLKLGVQDTPFKREQGRIFVKTDVIFFPFGGLKSIDSVRFMMYDVRFLFFQKLSTAGGLVK